MTQTTADTDVISHAIWLACRAPSLHNTQPWLWTVGQNAHGNTTVELFLDHKRIVRSMDGSGRQALISCGAALDHFRVAMSAAGWHTTVDLFPNPGQLDHLATAEFTPAQYVTDAERDRAGAILERRTDRLPFRAPGDWDSIATVLESTVDRDLATVRALSSDARSTLAEASRLTESFRRYDESYHDELHWWTEPFRLYQGIPQETLVSEQESDRVAINRTFPTKTHSDRRPEVLQDEARVLVLSTPEHSRRDALMAGQALSTVLLECTMAGLATCPLTHLTEFSESRVVIQNLLGDNGFPQVLVRVGEAPVLEAKPAATPRRPLSEVLQHRH